MDCSVYLQFPSCAFFPANHRNTRNFKCLANELISAFTDFALSRRFSSIEYFMSPDLNSTRLGSGKVDGTFSKALLLLDVKFLCVLDSRN